MDNPFQLIYIGLVELKQIFSKFEIASTTAKRDKKKKNCKRRKPKKVNWAKIIDLLIVVAKLTLLFNHK
jgi:hypothetical protein